MTSKRSGSKAKSGAGARAGKSKPKKGNLRDLEAKDDQKVRGGGEFTITKTTDSSSPKLFTS